MPTPDRSERPLPPPAPADSGSDPAVADLDHGSDPETSREGLELELMDEDVSEAGEHIGDHNP